MGALAGGGIAAIEVKFVNAGLFEKSVAYFAAQQKTTPEAVKKQWAAAAGQMLPAVLGGDPSALKVAAEAQKFIAAPTNLTIARASEVRRVQVFRRDGRGRRSDGFDRRARYRRGRQQIGATPCRRS